MIKLHRILLAGAVLALATTSTMAGSLGAGELNAGVIADTVVAVPNDVHSPILQLTASYTLSGTGSLAGVATPSDVTTLDLSNLSSFTLTSGTFSFTSTGGSFNTSTFGGSKFLVGTLTGWATIGGDSSAATLSFNFSQIGSGLVGGGLTVVVAAVPEPSSVALAGIGLAAAGLFGLRKRLVK